MYRFPQDCQQQDEDLSQIVCIRATSIQSRGTPHTHLHVGDGIVTLTVNKLFCAVGSSDAMSLHNRWSDGNAVNDEKDVKDACTYIAKYAAKQPLVKKKRERSLYTYNFSPPSTPRGNHTIAIDADTVTTRCSKKKFMSIQQENRLICTACGALMKSIACNRLCFECNNVFIV